MDITVRSYLTAGVALAGASAIAIAPAVVPPPSTMAAPPISAVAVDLSAAVNPITAWVDVVTGATANLGGLGAAWLADPFPLLRQALTNVLGYGGTVFTAGGGVINGTLQYLSFSNEDGLWAQLGNAVEEIFQGQISTGFNTLINAFLVGPLVNIGLPIFTSGLLDIPVQIADNAANLVKTFFSLETLVPLAFGVLTPMAGVLAATGDSLQASFDALVQGNLIDAVISLINLPAAVVGAVLNGYTNSDDQWLAGIFSFNDEDPGQGGLLQALLVTLPKALAAAIAPQVPAAARVAADEVSDPEVGGGTMFALTNVQTEDAAAGTETVTESETAAPVPTAPEEPAAAIVDTPEEDAAEETDPTTDDGTGAEDTTAPDPEETDEDTGAEDELTDETETDTDDTDTDTDDTDTDDGNDAGDAPSGAAGDGADSGGSDGSDSGDE
jgi:hypothetical protein